MESGPQVPVCIPNTGPVDTCVSHDIEVMVESESASDDADLEPDPPRDPCVSTDATHVHTGGDTPDNVKCTTTVPPIHLEQEVEDENVRNVVLQTCKQLLLKIETVRLSVLHLQYSMHAGGLGVAPVETSDRSKQLWSWNHPGIFATDPVDGVQFPEGVFTHKSEEDEFQIPRDVFAPSTLEELQLPGGIYDVFDIGSSPDTANVSITSSDDVPKSSGCVTVSDSGCVTIPDDAHGDNELGCAGETGHTSAGGV